MSEVGKIRNQISAHWHNNIGLVDSKPAFGFLNKERYDAFCASKDWIQDTCQAISQHRARGFSSDPLDAYIEFWGVMQATFVQQEAIARLHFSITGKNLPKQPRPSAWWELRDKRNLAVGHPVHRDRSPPGETTATCVSGREGKSYAIIPLMISDANGVRVEEYNLGQALDSYDSEASKIMGTILLDFKKLI